MKKKILTLVLVLGMIMSLFSNCLIYAENSIPTSIEKPQDFTVRIGDQEINLRWRVPQSILDLIENSDGGDSIFYAIDWKQDNGAWHFENKVPGDPSYLDGYFDPFGIFFEYQGSSQVDDNNTSDTFLVAWHLYPELDTEAEFDFVNKTYYFRMRFIYEYVDENTGELKYIFSPYTDVAALGKNASNTAITKLDAPKDLKVELKKDSNGKPYFALNWTIPESVKEANKSLPVYHRIDFKVGNDKWYSELVGKINLPVAPSNLLSNNDVFDPIEKNYVDKIVIEENVYRFRILFEAEPSIDKFIQSDFSNEFSLGVERYSNASDWAKGELDKAGDLGLIPDILKGADMTKGITRREFAALSVKLYEKLSGSTATPSSTNPFTDTSDVEVLKAYNLGITDGVSIDKFDPDKILNREQAATMLTRVFKRTYVEGWSLKEDSKFKFNYTMPTKFSDDAKISDWAKPSVYFMVAHKIINGIDSKTFAPKATTSYEQATNYAIATREQAIAIAIRMIENLDEEDAKEIVPSNN